MSSFSPARLVALWIWIWAQFFYLLKEDNNIPHSMKLLKDEMKQFIQMLMQSLLQISAR